MLNEVKHLCLKNDTLGKAQPADFTLLSFKIAFRYNQLFIHFPPPQEEKLERKPRVLSNVRSFAKAAQDDRKKKYSLEDDRGNKSLYVKL